LAIFFGRRWGWFFFFGSCIAGDGLSTSSTSLSLLDGHREDKEEQVEEVDKNSSSLISIEALF